VTASDGSEQPSDSPDASGSAESGDNTAPDNESAVGSGNTDEIPSDGSDATLPSEANAWNAGSLPDLYDRVYGAGTQDVGFYRNNGEYVNDGPGEIVGDLTELNAPNIPEALLPQGGKVVMSAKDRAGNI
jgi:hypothetical protein